MRLSPPEAPPPAIASPLKIAAGVFITQPLERPIKNASSGVRNAGIFSLARLPLRFYRLTDLYAAELITKDLQATVK
jgi:hypothetical protein